MKPVKSSLSAFALLVSLAVLASASPSASAQSEAMDAAESIASVPAKIGSVSMYGPVKAGETLWSIARRYSEGSQTSIRDWVNAFVKENPEVLGTNAASLRAGVTLKVPTALQKEPLQPIRVENASPSGAAAPTVTVTQSTAGAQETSKVAPSIDPPIVNETPAPAESMLRRRRQQGDAAPPVVNPSVVQVVHPKRNMDPLAQPVSVRAQDFLSDPVYEIAYDADKQLEIYGGKRAVYTARPLMELGYPLYAAGAFGAGHAWFGEKNLARPQFLVYGDYRLAYGNSHDVSHKSLLSTRLNLDLDLKLTGTERFHVLMRPLDKKGSFTRIEFDGAPTPDGKDEELEINVRPDAAFFEGDLGQIAQGITGRYNGVDLPIALGLVPLLFQNGVWLDDTFTGFALTIPARNSRALDISNFDITLFAGLDEVSTAGVGLNGGQLPLHAAKIVGLATFFESNSGYYEVDFGYVHDDDRLGGFDHSYSNVSAAASHRWKNWISWSARVIHNFGQEAAPGFQKTADGTLLIWESSLISRLPYTMVPYFNLFYGDGRPQSLARDAGAGGILKNTGLNFETDGLTGFPKMDDTAANAHGGAVGLEYLFSLNRQIVVEAAAQNRHGDRKALGSEYALGVRFQQPISSRWIVRADAIVGGRENGSDFSGVRAELRCKF